MDSITQLLFVILSSLYACFLLFYFYNHQFRKPKNNRLPRASGALPIIGHLHLFGSKQLLHETLGTMADKYGPAFSMKLGSQETLVVSSWQMAKECFTTLDRVFADRPKITASIILGYDCAMFGLAPYGPYWRQMRKIATLELLSHHRLDMLSHIRASEVQTSMKELYDFWASSKQSLKTGMLMDLKQWFADLTLNASVRMVVGKRFVGTGADGEKEEGKSHQKVMRDFIFYFGVFPLSDAIPSLGWLDWQGHDKAMKRIAKDLDALIEKWLDEHKERRRRISEERKVDQDFMDVMLTSLEGAEFTEYDADTIIKSTCLNLVLAASDTTTVTLTWALTLLLNNPHAMKKAQEEVDTYISKDRQVRESDLKDLVYLHSVVKETLRLYPPNPVIGLRCALEDCTISPGYHVSSGTRLMVNVRKIQRDADRWPEPNEFRPERFLTSHKDVDIRGRQFELIPFGSGRRSCPGISLALQMVHLTLASLLHCYEFARPDGAEIDMTESPGLTNLKATPLEVYITPRVDPQVFGT